MFWRWNKLQQHVVKEGFSVCIFDRLSINTKPAGHPKRKLHHLHLKKVKDIFSKGYVQLGSLDNGTIVTSYMDYFNVPKVDAIQMVYTGSSYSVNCGIENRPSA